MAPAINTIMVPTDFSEAADAALAFARALARGSGAALHVVHVIQGREEADGESPAPPACTGLSTRLRGDERKRLDETHVTIIGRPAAQIAKYAADHAVDCVVMGTRGRCGVNRPPGGGVADKVARTVCCPVVTVHGTHRGVRLM
jgi:nucleotide-binding universal stress UspA family protein